MRKYQAFTIIESIVYVTVLSMIVGTITSLVVQIYRFQSIVEDRAQINEDLRVLTKSLRDDMYFGVDFTLVSANEISIDHHNGTETITYFLQNDQVFRRVNAGANVPITNDNSNVKQFLIEDITTPSGVGVIRVTIEVGNYPRGPIKPNVNEQVTTTFSLKFV